MGQFSISDLEQLSGIKAHTIRMWEQRYACCAPVAYGHQHPHLLRRRPAPPAQRGHAVRPGPAHLASGAPQREELAKAVLACTDDPHDYAPAGECAAGGHAGNERASAQLRCLPTTTASWALKTAMMYVAYPFLQRIGLMWQAGTINPAQEHLVTNLLRQKDAGRHRWPCSGLAGHTAAGYCFCPKASCTSWRCCS